MFDRNSFDETIIDVYIIGRGFRFRRKVSRQVNSNGQDLERGATQMNLHERMRTAVPREEEIPGKSIITCAKGLFEAVELGYRKQRDNEVIVSHQSVADEKRVLTEGSGVQGGLGVPASALEEVSEVLKSGTGYTGPSRSCQ